MDILQITQYVSMGIPIVAFAALAVSVFIFVKSKGTMDALKEAADTYRTLAEAYQAQVEQLEYKIECLQAEIVELKKALEVERQATRVAIDEMLSGIRRMNGGTK